MLTLCNPSQLPSASHIVHWLKTKLHREKDAPAEFHSLGRTVKDLSAGLQQQEWQRAIPRPILPTLPETLKPVTLLPTFHPPSCPFPTLLDKEKERTQLWFSSVTSSCSSQSSNLAFLSYIPSFPLLFCFSSFYYPLRSLSTGLRPLTSLTVAWLSHTSSHCTCVGIPAWQKTALSFTCTLGYFSGHSALLHSSSKHWTWAARLPSRAYRFRVR